MIKQQILIEELTPVQSNIITESVSGGKDLYLQGIFMQAECVNGNGRNYPVDEIAAAVKYVNEKIAEGVSICGELNHPSDLAINLERVSHVITEMHMEGNDAIGKAKLLNTPMGNIAKALIDGGVRIGVSSRGTGEVNEGVVSGFQFVTVDIVSTPSAPNAFPSVISESMQRIQDDRRIVTLAEHVCNDKDAQKYLAKALKGFIEQLRNGY